MKSTNFQPIKKCDFADPLGPTKEIKVRSLVDFTLFIALEKVENNRLYL